MGDKNKVASGFFWSYAERITAQGVSFLVSIILARLIAPSDYGTIALITIFITICNVFVTGGYGNALIQKKDADELDFSTIFYLSFVISLGIYALIFFAAPIISRFYEMPQLTSVIRVMALRLPIASINSIQHAYIQKRMMFRKFFFSTLIGTCISAIVGIMMAHNGFGYWALVAQYLTNTGINTIVLFLIVDWHPRRMFAFSRLKRMFAFGSRILFSRLIDTVYIELRSLIIGKKFGASDLAYYNRGKQFPDIIVTNIDSSITKVLFPAIASIQDDKVRVKQVTRRAMTISTFIMSPLLVGLAIIAPTVVELVLTDKWLPSVPFLQIFCIMYIFRPLNTANMQAIQALGRADIYLNLEIIKKIYGLIVLLISIFAFNSVNAVAVGHAITSISASLINAYPNRKLLNYGYLEQALDVLPNFLLAGCMGLGVSLITLVNVGMIGKLILQVLVGATIYLGIARIFKMRSLYYLIDIIKSIWINKHSLKET